LEIPVTKAALTLTGQDLSLSVGDSIPDLNYTVSGWKHSDASLAIGANPLALASLELWLDASDDTSITHTSNAVSQWSDKSGNSKHATQSTADSKPSTNTATLNGLNVLDFTGDFLVSSININRSTMADLSIFAVFASKSTSGEGSLYGSDNGGWDRLAVLNFDANSGAKWGVSNAG
jgi:hypothetical protein